MRLDWAGSGAYPLEFLKTRKNILQADVCDVVCSMCNRYANANDSLVAALIDASRRGRPAKRPPPPYTNHCACARSYSPQHVTHEFHQPKSMRVR